MAILYKGKVIRKIEYKGIKIKKAYKDNVLIFSDSFFTKLLVRMSSTRIDGRKNILNLSWETWEEERVRLSNIVADKQRDYNKAVDDLKPYEDAYNKAVRDRDSWLSSHPKPPEERVTQAWKDWDDVRRYLLDVYRASVRSLERYKEKEPTKTIDNPDWTTWEAGRVERLQNKVDAANYLNGLRDTWQAAVDAYDARVEEVNTAATAFNNATTAFNDAVAARDAHKAKEPDKTITVTKENPDWTTWDSERDRWLDKVEDTNIEYRNAVHKAEDAHKKARAARKAYQDYVDTILVPDDTSRRLLAEAEAAEAEASRATSEAQRLGEIYSDTLKAYDAWLSSHPEPPETITVTEDNPEWATWEAKRKELQQKVNSTYADMNSKEAEAKRLKTAWDADEPTYAQNIHSAETDYDNYNAYYEEVSRTYDDWLTQEPDKTITNPAWTTWNNGLPPYEEAVARDKKNYDDHLAKEPTKYEPNPDYDRWIRDKKVYDDAVSSAYYAKAPYESIKNSAKSALESAQRDYNNHLSKEPAKRIETSAAYYKYSFDISFKDLPTPEDISNDSLTIRVKINNTQSEADRQDAIFIGQDRGPNPAYLDGSLNLKNTSTTLTTTWASMDMIYSEANITISSSEGFTKTYVIDINKDFITDDFMFRYPD